MQLCATCRHQTWHLYTQAEASGDISTLKDRCCAEGLSVWHDMDDRKMSEDLTEKGTRQGVRHLFAGHLFDVPSQSACRRFVAVRVFEQVYDSDILVLFLTNAALSRIFCLREIKWAIEFGKPVVIIVETGRRFRKWDIGRWESDQCTRDPISWGWSAGWLPKTVLRC